MPFVQELSVGALSGDVDAKLNSLIRQLNEWAAEISNEKLTLVQRGDDGTVRIVQGAQEINGTRVVGTVYYDNSGVDRIFIGLDPSDNEPVVAISKDGESVIGLLEG